MNTDLEKCPFCGGEPTVKRDHKSATFCTWIQCTKCGARTSSDDSYGGAKAAWNKRPSEPVYCPKISELER